MRTAVQRACLIVLSREPLSSRLPTARRHRMLPRWPRSTRTSCKFAALHTRTVVSPPEQHQKRTGRCCQHSQRKGETSNTEGGYTYSPKQQHASCSCHDGLSATCKSTSPLSHILPPCDWGMTCDLHATHCHVLRTGTGKALCMHPLAHLHCRCTAHTPPGRSQARRAPQMGPSAHQAAAQALLRPLWKLWG